MAENYGVVKQVIGPTVDLEFDSDHLPEARPFKRGIEYKIF